MAMVERIACFLTCGYTESGTMQAFLRKINSSYEYKQFLPNKIRKKKGTEKIIADNINGLTGEKLIAKVYDILKNHSNEIKECKAIIIEDDLDGRFNGWSGEKIKKYKRDIIFEIQENIGIRLPVFFIYASPEIESWFIADWKNGYKYLYTSSEFVEDLELNERKFFVNHLKKYINKHILRGYQDNIEHYGFFNDEYIKLSDKIKEAIEFDCKEYISHISKLNHEMVQKICNSKKLYYSKKYHGSIMLKNIDPDIVASKCTCYFQESYLQLKQF